MKKSEYCFRDHLTDLEAARLLIRVEREVDPKYEIPALIKKASKLGKAIYFQNVKGHDHPVAANVCGSRKMISIALSLSTENFLKELLDRVSSSSFSTCTLQVSNAPVQQVVEEGEEALDSIPFLTHFERDAGKYITAGSVIAKDPESGFRNASFNRMMVRGDGRLGIRMMPPQHLGIIQGKVEANNKNLEVAVVLGNHPAEMIASASLLPFGKDHLDFASSIRGAPVRTVKCKTVDLEVPADAELVIEGEIEANLREEEGPFGEFMDYYVERGKNHVLRVRAVTHRQDYIYQGLLCGSREDLGILALSRELVVLKALLSAGYDVQDVSLMPFLFNGVISIRKKFEGEPKNAMMAAFGAYSWLKYCVVVDDDVDIHELDDVWWAIATRSQPDKGVIMIPDALGFPRKDKWQIHRGKLGLDATVPLELKKQFERKKIPREDEVDF